MNSTPTEPKLLVHLPPHLPPVLAEEERESLVSFFPGYLLLLSSVWKKETFARAGSTEAWLWDTVNAKDFQTREYRFAGFVLPSHEVEDAIGARLVFTALDAKRPVWVRIDDDVWPVCAIRPAAPPLGWSVSWQITG